MQSGSDAAAFAVLTGVIKFCREHKHSVRVRDGFCLLERRSLIVAQNLLEIINRLIELRRG